MGGDMAFTYVLAMFVFLIIGAIAVLFIGIRQGWLLGPESLSLAQQTADDIQTGAITVTTAITGTTGMTQTSGLVPILSTTITTEECVDRLYCNVSAFTSMVTTDETNALGTESITSNLASVLVQVLVDGVLALPGAETFNGVLHVVDAQLGARESLDLLDDRAICNSFEFIAPVTSGSHTIQVMAEVSATSSGTAAGLASVTAGIFDRTLVVRQGRVSSSCNTAVSSSVSLVSG
jgi:hypothetical protein